MRLKETVIANVSLTKIVMEAAVGVRDKVPRNSSSELSEQTKDLITKRKHMKRSRRDTIELPEITKLISSNKSSDI